MNVVNQINKDWLNLNKRDWPIIQVKYLFKVLNGATPSSSEPLYWDGEINWFTPDDLGNNKSKFISSSNRTITDEGFESCGVRLAPSGSIAISTRAPIGHLAILSNEGCINQGGRLLVPKNVDPSFYYYIFLSAKDILQNLGQGTTFTELSKQKLSSFKVLFPSPSEQFSIAKFLDYKTTQIDTLIEKKEQLLKLLEEKRIALITNAVTGHVPSLREGIKGWADSGISWLGTIPQHWKVKRLRFVTKLNPAISAHYDDDMLVSFIPMEKIHENGGIDLDIEKTFEEVKKGYTDFINNDVIVAKITPCFENGKCSLVDGLTNGIGFGTTELHVLRCSKFIIPEYLFFYSISYPFRKKGEAEMYGAGGQKRVPEEFMKDFIIPVPPQPEQKQIVEYLNKELTKIDQLSEKVTTAIEKLKEYRTSLITSAVTGKIDLRNWQSNN